MKSWRRNRNETASEQQYYSSFARVAGSGGGRCREEAAFQPRVEEEKLRKRKKVKALSVVSSLEGRNTEWKSQSEVMKNV